MLKQEKNPRRKRVADSNQWGKLGGVDLRFRATHSTLQRAMAWRPPSEWVMMRQEARNNSENSEKLPKIFAHNFVTLNVLIAH